MFLTHMIKKEISRFNLTTLKSIACFHQKVMTKMVLRFSRFSLPLKSIVCLHHRVILLHHGHYDAKSNCGGSSHQHFALFQQVLHNTEKKVRILDKKKIFNKDFILISQKPNQKKTKKTQPKITQ